MYFIVSNCIIQYPLAPPIYKGLSHFEENVPKTSIFVICPHLCEKMWSKKKKEPLKKSDSIFLIGVYGRIILFKQSAPSFLTDNTVNNKFLSVYVGVITLEVFHGYKTTISEDSVNAIGIVAFFHK